MKRIVSLRVLYEDGTQEEWMGEGNVADNRTTVTDETGGHESAYRYVQATLRVRDAIE